MADPTNNQDLMYGPFTQYLTGSPALQQQPAQPSGFGGKGEHLAVFASRFLQGLQQGRRQQFEQAELAKARHMQTFQKQYEAIQSDPAISPDDKAKARDVYMQALAGAAHDAIDGGQGGGKKGGASSGGGGKSQQGHPNPLVNFAKQIFGGVAGPAQDKSARDITPAQIGDLASLYHNAQRVDPAKITEQATQGLDKIANTYAQDFSAKYGFVPDRNAIAGLPQVQAIRQDLLQKLGDPNRVEQIMGSFLGKFQEKPNAAQQAQIDEANAITAHQKELTRQSQSGQREPYVVFNRDANGRVVGTTTVDRNTVTGKLYKPGTQEEYTPPPNSMAVPSASALYTSSMTAQTQADRIAAQERIERMRENNQRLIEGIRTSRIKETSKNKDSIQLVRNYQQMLQQKQNAQIRLANRNIQQSERAKAQAAIAEADKFIQDNSDAVGLAQENLEREFGSKEGKREAPPSSKKSSSGNPWELLFGGSGGGTAPPPGGGSPGTAEDYLKSLGR